MYDMKNLAKLKTMAQLAPEEAHWQQRDTGTLGRGRRERQRQRQRQRRASEESNTGPRSNGVSVTPAAANQRFHSSLR